MSVKKNQEVKLEMDSSFIKMTCYHYGLHRLKIVFKQKKLSAISNQLSATYIFYKVPIDVYLQLLDNGSSGRYFNREIKNRYNCEKQ